MKNNYDHIENQINREPDGDFFDRVEIPYGKSRDEAWLALEEKLSDPSRGRLRALRPGLWLSGIAAGLLLLGGIFSLFRFYTKSVYSPSGQHITCELPDGSKAFLNAESRITYRPLWWGIAREVKFEGEGYFEVEKGKKFSVASKAGTTEVLGTSFNIFARDMEYKVTCITGKVKVISYSDAEVILGPEYSAEVSGNGDIRMTKAVDGSQTHSWVNNMFNFTSRPVELVFEEISRQYDVKIRLALPAGLLYTGHFSKNRPLEETLTLVCTPFGLTFARISDKEYEISQD